MWRQFVYSKVVIYKIGKYPGDKIYITPTTFVYNDFRSNLLWQKESDVALLQKVMAVKRESRMEYDNSEDALTWNVFRYLVHQLLLLLRRNKKSPPDQTDKQAGRMQERTGRGSWDRRDLMLV